MFKKITPYVLGLIGTLTVTFALPLSALAQVGNACADGLTLSPGSIEYILCRVIGVLTGLIIPLLIALAVVWFIWGVIQFISAKDEEAKGEARSTMIHGIIALFVIVAMWGLVKLVQNFFQVGTGGASDQGLIIPGL